MDEVAAEESAAQPKRWGGQVLDHVPEGMYTRKEAAEKVGRSYDTIRTWHRNGVFKATKKVTIGKTEMWVYDDDDIGQMEVIAGNMRTGPKKKEDGDG